MLLAFAVRSIGAEGVTVLWLGGSKVVRIGSRKSNALLV